MAWGNVEGTDFTVVNAGNSSSVVASVATLSAAANEGLVFLVSSHGNRTFTTPTGLTLIDSHLTSVYMYLFEKLATGSDADETFTASSSGDLTAYVFKFGGDFSGLGGIIDKSAFNAAGGLDDSPSITPSAGVDPCDVFAAFFDQSGYAAPTVPTGMTLVKDNDFSGENKQSAVAYEDYSGLAATGLMTWHDIAGTTGHASFNVKRGAVGGGGPGQGQGSICNQIGIGI